MNRRTFVKAIAAAASVRLAEGQYVPPPITGIYTRSGDNLRSGAYTTEKTITPANVKDLKFYFDLTLEGDARGAEAQPLFVPAVLTEDGRRRNLLIIAAMNNDLLCFDQDDSAVVWEHKLGYPIVGARSFDMWGVNDHWGILSTPVIDPDTNLIYCVAWTSPDGTPGNASHSIHVRNLKDGSEARTPFPLAGITYSAGAGIPENKWATGWRKQRSSLLMTNVNGRKTVFFAAGSVFETSNGVSGWIVAYDVATATVTALATAPRYFGGGIWMAGQGITADAAGNLYFVTGNGGFDGITDFSECFCRAQYTPPTGNIGASIKIVDWWSPYTDSGRVGKSPTLPSANDLKPKVAGLSKPSASLATPGMPVNGMMTMTSPADFNDQDLGSSGINLIPEYGLAFGSGKDGILYVMNMANMGKTSLADMANPAGNYAKLKAPPIWYTYYPGPGINPAPNNPADLDFFAAARTHHMHSTSVVWKSPTGYRVYCCGENGNVRVWSVDQSGVFKYLGCSAEYASPNAPEPPGGMPGGMMCLSSNGTSNAVLFVAMPLGDANKVVSKGNVYAYDAYNLGKYSDGSGELIRLWTSPEYVYNKFDPPVVSGGKLFVTTYDGKITAYGL